MTYCRAYLLVNLNQPLVHVLDKANNNVKEKRSSLSLKRACYSKIKFYSVGQSFFGLSSDDKKTGNLKRFFCVETNQVHDKKAPQH